MAKLLLFSLLITANLLHADVSTVETDFATVTGLYHKDFVAIDLTPVFQWLDDEDVSVADVQLNGNKAIFAASRQLAATNLDSDSWSMILCHEVGHVLGGAPFTWVNPDDGGVLAAEGQADYFAAAKCLRRLWTRDDENRQAVALIDPDLVARIRQQGCATDQCVRIVNTSLKILTAIEPEQSFSIDHRSTVTVSDTLTSTISNSAQCRLDTALAGALCEVDPTVGFSNLNQRDGACVTGPGARPACWFHTDDLDGIY